MPPVWKLGDEAYVAEVERVAREESVEAAISLIMRESRYVTTFFPAYASGAGDMIERWMEDLREEWARAARAERTAMRLQLQPSEESDTV